MNIILLTILIVSSNAAHASCGKKFKVAHQAQPTSYSSGPTALAMAMNYYGSSYTGMDVCTWIGNCERSTGTDFSEMLSAAQHYGFTNAAWKYGVSEIQDRKSVV